MSLLKLRSCLEENRKQSTTGVNVVADNAPKNTHSPQRGTTKQMSKIIYYGVSVVVIKNQKEAYCINICQKLFLYINWILVRSGLIKSSFAAC